MEKNQVAKKVNRFKDEILQDVGEVSISDTQKIRVLRVWDVDLKQVKLSVQKWWRPDNKSEWVAGKGFKLDSSEASALGLLLEKGTKEFR